MPDTISSFDLNRLNWRGWLLVLATGAFAMGQAPLIVYVMETVNPQHRRFAGTLSAALAVYLAWYFFRAVRWMLTRLGWSIYR